MAKVFLSYARGDSTFATALAAALEKSGHSAWLDRDIKAGAQFAEQIERALADAEAVVVLWSVASVKSEWVRDEASEARESGKLIPVTIDGTKPPMGFRQFQCIELHANNRLDDRRMQQLLTAISSLRQSAGSPNAETGLPHKRRPRTRRKSIVSITALSLLTIALGLGLYARTRSEFTSVTVVAGDQSAASRELARRLLFSLSNLQTSQASSVDILSDGVRRADLLFQVIAHHDHERASAQVALVSRTKGRVLWSAEISPSSGSSPDLDQQLALSAGRLIECTQEATPPRAKIEDHTLKTYLNGCARLPDLIGRGSNEVVDMFRQVTRQQPKFAPAWAKLLLALAETAPIEEQSDTRGSLDEIRRSLSRARSLDPAMPEADFAAISLISEDDNERRLTMANRAVAVHPDDPHLLMLRSKAWANVGLWDFAIADARKATEVDPLSPALTSNYITTLGYGGQIQAAFVELARAERRWPGASNLLDTRFWMDFRFGDAREALRLFNAGVVHNVPARLATVIQAKAYPSASNLQLARSVVRDAVQQSNAEDVGIQGYGEVGIVSELWPILLPRQHIRPVVFSVLLRPSFAELRRDPRFLQLAAHAGVLQYWQRSGNWPDFCAAPDLPYDCQSVAESITRGVRPR